MKEIVFIDTFHQYENYTREDYIEYMRDINDEEITLDEIDDDAYWKWHYDMCEWDVDDFFFNLKHSQIEGEVVITGMLGLWNGNPEIEPVVCKDLYTAISTCTNNMNDFKVAYEEDGNVRVYGYHHDGTNVFTLHGLSKKGERHVRSLYSYGNAEIKPYMLKRLTNPKNPWLF